MKLPGPDHPITITATPKRIRVSAGGVVIADTTHALTLKEASYPAVQYVPRKDANMELLARTDRVTRCPYKGTASYYSAKVEGGKDLVWYYEQPLDEVGRIKGLVCFFNEKVDIELDGELQQRPDSPWSHRVKSDAQNDAPALTRG